MEYHGVEEGLFAGRYRFLGQLGAGAMGVVHRAQDVQTDRVVAIKVLSTSLSGQAKAVHRFEREMQATSLLEHPNTVRLYDFGRDPAGDLYLVMELVEGVTLEQLIDLESRLAPSRVVHIGKQIARALVAAHAEGIVHRDLKPGNILVHELYGEPDCVKVLDFGIARLNFAVGEESMNLTGSGTFIGTAYYASPEQAVGEKADHRSDLYSLGCVLHHALTGQPPFQAENVVGLLYKHVHEEPEDPGSLVSDVAPWLNELCLRLLAKDRAARPQTAGDVLACLSREEAPAPVTAPSLAQTTPSPAPSAFAAETTPSGAANGHAATEVSDSVPQMPGPEMAFKPLETHGVSREPTHVISSFGSRVALMVAAFALLVVGAIGWFGGEEQTIGEEASNPGPAGISPTSVVPEAPAGTKGLREGGVEEAPPSAGHVRVTIRSVPPGAQVIWEGQVLGLTDLHTEFPEGGFHSVSLEKEGYMPHHTGFKAEPGTTVRAQLSLKSSSAVEPGPLPEKATPAPRRKRPKARKDRRRKKPSGAPVKSRVKRIKVPEVERLKVD